MTRTAKTILTIFGGDFSNMANTCVCGREQPASGQKRAALMNSLKWFALSLFGLLFAGPAALAGEGDLAIPDLHNGFFVIFGYKISPWWLLFDGAIVIAGTLG